MKQNHMLRRLFAASVSAAIVVSLTPAANAAEPNPLNDYLTEFSQYWQAPSEPYDGTGAGGKVLNSKVLADNDRIIQAINQAAAIGATADSPTSQQRRALSDRDADKDVAHEFKDGFGPILGEYFEEGYNNGDLDKVKEVMESNGWSGNPSKEVNQYPRPYTQRDTWLPSKDYLTAGSNDMGDLSATLNIYQVPDAEGSDGKTHSASYPKNSYEGSFPSGHTNKAYSRGVVLATMIPQLAPEILARTSEAGNNRIVLGVHYPLDVMAGRIGGMASYATYWKANEAIVKEASAELQSYLSFRCKEDGYGDTLAQCISNTGADDDRGYSNDFTDIVSTEPVTDRTSALKAYRARMTYGFSQVGEAGQSFTAPDEAALLLSYAYPTLTNEQRNTVLSATAIDSGYAFDASSKGWQRIDLAKALSSKVTLDTQGEVINVEDAKAPEVVIASESSAANEQEQSHILPVIGAVAVIIAIIAIVTITAAKRKRV